MMINLAVLMCIWQRVERLPKTLAMLEAQTNQDFDLYLINNNQDVTAQVDRAVTTWQMKAVKCVSVFTNECNRGAFDKYRYAHKMIKAGYEYTHYLSIDDDFEFGPKYIAQVKTQARDNAIVGWTVHEFTGNYWQKKHVPVGARGNLVDGKGAIIPAAVLSDERVLEIPPDMVNADNLWLSYFATHILGLEIVKGLFVDCKSVKDGKDTWPSIKAEKAVFLEDLRQRGWEV